MTQIKVSVLTSVNNELDLLATKQNKRPLLIPWYPGWPPYYWKCVPACRSFSIAWHSDLLLPSSNISDTGNWLKTKKRNKKVQNKVLMTSFYWSMQPSILHHEKHRWNQKHAKLMVDKLYSWVTALTWPQYHSLALTHYITPTHQWL